ncbi:MAG: choice-of-anchor J domain-containing protein [Bacteroidales bacterium]|jgi:hypothetical protein|nr:choice-of-anchor J domain-containing protein [Bacteroidales bacterium]
MNFLSKLVSIVFLLGMSTIATSQCLNPSYYTMNFEDGEDFSMWSYSDENADENIWDVYDYNGNICAGYSYSTTDAADDYLFSPCFTLEAGKTYELSFSYVTQSEGTFPESLRVLYGTTADATVSNLIVDLGTFAHTDYRKSIQTITVSTTDEYYFAWHCYSDADMYNLYIDSIVVRDITENPTSLANLSTIDVFSITENSAYSGGAIIDNGGTEIINRGVCWSTSPLPTILDVISDAGSGSGNFITDMPSLFANTTYYARAFAINSVGTAYGNEISFTTHENTLVSNQSEVESNNTSDEANVFDIHSIMSGSVGVDDDAYDWYTLTVPYDGKLEFNGIAESTLGLYIELFNQNSTTSLVYTRGLLDEDVVMSYDNIKAGTYYLRVGREFIDGAYSYGNYTIENIFTPTSLYDGNDTEPNDIFEESKMFSINTSTTGHIGYSDGVSQDDYDWYTITIPYDGKIDLYGFPESMLGLYIELFNQNGTASLVYTRGLLDEDVVMSYDNIKAGTYYLRVGKEFIDGTYSYGSYIIENTFTPTSLYDGNDTEPNDISEESQIFSINTSTTGHLGYSDGVSRDDYDWYTITVPYDGKIDLYGFPESTLGLYIELFNQNSTASLVYTRGLLDEDVVMSYDNIKAGTYYLRVGKEFVDGVYSYGSYTIENSFTPTDLFDKNDVEPNNTDIEAQTVDFVSPFSGHIGYSDGITTDDSDWYVFTTTDETRISIDGLAENTLALDFTLLEANGSTVIESISATTTGEAVRLTYDNLPVGTYYLKVLRVNLSQGYTFGSYTLEIISGFVATVPTVATMNVNSITTNSAVSGASISHNGGAAISGYGILWSTNPNPSLDVCDGYISHVGDGVGDFSSSTSDLLSNTTYYIRAYATNSEGTGYGNEIEFTTLEDNIPTDFGGGSGSVSDPWQIYTAEQLNNVRNYLGDDDSDKHFILMNDIDLTDFLSEGNAGYNDGSYWEPIGDVFNKFAGHFDGNNNEIINIKSTNSSYVGLFGYTTETAVIENTGIIIDPTSAITGTSSSGYVGGLVGMAYGSTISDCYVIGDVVAESASAVGGLVGASSEPGSIINCYSEGSVQGNEDVGGLIGNSGKTSILNSYSEMNVSGTNNVGGLVGDSWYSVIDSSYATGTVTASGEYSGGFVGNVQYDSITNSYASGDVYGGDYVGGFAGSLSDANLTRVYAKGHVTGLEQVGGLVGSNATGIIDYAYSTGKVIGTTNVGGLVGESKWSGETSNSFWNVETSLQLSSEGGSGISILEMKNPATFFGWDFSSVWTINENKNDGYPYFSWQIFDNQTPDDPTLNITQSAISIVAYPNPTNSCVTLSGINGDVQFFVTNNEGKVVISITESKYICLDGLANGTYFIHVIFQNGMKHIVPVVKQ